MDDPGRRLLGATSGISLFVNCFFGEIWDGKIWHTHFLAENTEIMGGPNVSLSLYRNPTVELSGVHAGV